MVKNIRPSHSAELGRRSTSMRALGLSFAIALLGCSSAKPPSDPSQSDKAEVSTATIVAQPACDARVDRSCPSKAQKSPEPAPPARVEAQVVPENSAPPPPKPRSGLARGDGSPSDVEIEAGDRAIAEERFTEAETHYRRATELAPKDPAPRVGVIRAALAGAGIALDFASALGDAKVSRWADELGGIAQRNPNYGPALLERGRLLLLLGKAQPAMQALERAVTELPSDPEAHSALGVARLALGKKQDALAAFRKAADLEASEPGRFTNLGTAYMVLGQVNESLSAYQQALKLAPNEARAYADVGTAYLAAERPAEALPYLKRATELAPKRATFVSNLGYGYQKQGQLDLAVATYRRALDLDSRLGSAWLNLGTALAEQHQLDRAEEAFKKALAIDASDPRAQANLSDLEELRKRDKKGSDRSSTPGDQKTKKSPQQPNETN